MKKLTLLRARISRREAALVAAALLLPIPILAQSGLSVPLPGGVERGLGSLVTLDSEDRRSGTQTTGRASARSDSARQSGRGSLRIGRGGRAATLLENGTLSTGAAGGRADGSDRPAGESGSGSGKPRGADPRQ